MLRLKSFWFSEHPRKNLADYITGELRPLNKTMTDLSTFSQSDQDLIYRVAVTSAMTTCLFLIRYLAVHPDNHKPWIARKHIKHPLEIAEFDEYIDTVRRWLNKQPPTQNYGSLVYLQAMSKNLNTMEITDE